MQEDSLPSTSDSVPRTRSVPKSYDIIEYKVDEQSEWQTAAVMSRAGKQSGKCKWSVNVRNESEDPPKCVNLDGVADLR